MTLDRNQLSLHDRAAAATSALLWALCVAFTVANEPRDRKASGRTDDTIGLIKRGDSLQIISIKEARVRRPSRRRRRPPNFPAAVGRSVHKIFRSIFR